MSVRELALYVQWFVFLMSSTLVGHNFLNFNAFLTIFNSLNESIGGIHVFLGHQNQLSPRLGSSLSGALKCSLTSRSTLVRQYITEVFICHEIFTREYKFWSFG